MRNKLSILSMVLVLGLVGCSKEEETITPVNVDQQQATAPTPAGAQTPSDPSSVMTSENANKSPDMTMTSSNATLQPAAVQPQAATVSETLPTQNQSVPATPVVVNQQPTAVNQQPIAPSSLTPETPSVATPVTTGAVSATHVDNGSIEGQTTAPVATTSSVAGVQKTPQTSDIIVATPSTVEQPITHDEMPTPMEEGVS